MTACTAATIASVKQVKHELLQTFVSNGEKESDTRVGASWATNSPEETWKCYELGRFFRGESTRQRVERRACVLARSSASIPGRLPAENRFICAHLEGVKSDEALNNVDF